MTKKKNKNVLEWKNEIFERFNNMANAARLPRCVFSSSTINFTRVGLVSHQGRSVLSLFVNLSRKLCFHPSPSFSLLSVAAPSLLRSLSDFLVGYFFILFIKMIWYARWKNKLSYSPYTKYIFKYSVPKYVFDRYLCHFRPFYLFFSLSRLFVSIFSLKIHILHTRELGLGSTCV